ncbi:SapC family protein [Massilia sp. DD77]|uniref:SapC family protein n=1 Tax=Massilia sp. DD77 TaxID=3109349 RepID=UPI002FFFA22F
MPNIALLNNVDHKDLRIITANRPGLGDEVAWVTTFAQEFRLLQSDYPIIFRRAEGAVPFEAVALMGFTENENLFLGPEGWDAPAIPLMIARQPFLIGRKGDELMIQVDLDNPRVTRGDGEGEPVFLPHGGNSEYLQRVNAMLSVIHQGMEAEAGFLWALMKHELLETFALDITLDDGSQSRMSGFYTIHEERLAALSPAALHELHQAGHLAPIYYALASLSNFRGLIDRKNRRMKADAARR